MLDPALSCLEIAHADRMRIAVDSNDLCVCAHLDIKSLTEHFGRRDQQLSFVNNDVAHIVRQSAVCESHVGSAVEDDDLCRLVKTTESRGARCAPRHTSDNQDTPGRARVCRFDVGVIAHENSKSGCLGRSTVLTCTGQDSAVSAVSCFHSARPVPSPSSSACYRKVAFPL